MTVAALGALGLGGSAIAGAQQSTPTPTPTPGAGAAPPPHARPQRQPLAADVAAKVKAAALDEVPGATVLRTEAGGPDGAAYHAHIKAGAGKLEVVLVDSSFKATAVQADAGGHRGGPNGHQPETPLTGATKQKVEAAVLAKYPNATIERTETNTDSSAPYESHIRTADGRELVVEVDRDFTVAP
jgi:uncharacterized membrane protein YkoI